MRGRQHGSPNDVQFMIGPLGVEVEERGGGDVLVVDSFTDGHVVYRRLRDLGWLRRHWRRFALWTLRL